MGLIAWYPLNGDTLDYSGNNLNPYSNSTTIADGKIGQAASGGSISISNNPLINIKNNLSITFWIKRIADVTAYSEAPIAKYSGTPTANLRCYVFGASQELMYYANRGGAWGTISPGYYLPLNEWIHVSLVYNDGGQLYINGKPHGSKTGYGELALNTAPLTICSGSFAMNDVRIYDHALSDKEILEVSKAKVLHYTFDDYRKPIENLIENPTREVLANTNEFVEYIDLAPIFDTYGIDKKYSLSLDLKSQDTTNDNTIQIYMQNGSDAKYNFVQQTVTVTEEYQRFYFPNLQPSISDPEQTEAMLAFYGTYETGNRPAIRNVQLEIGEECNEFTVGSKSGRVFDISGHGHHGEFNTAKSPLKIAGSIIGDGCYEFHGANEISTDKIFHDNINQCHTVSAWVHPKLTLPVDGSQVNSKVVNFNSGYFVEFYNSYKTLCYLNSSASDSYVYGDILPRDQWALVTWVVDTDTQTCKVYYNGVLHAESANYTETDMPNGFMETTLIGTNFTGLMDDLRIYATALSDEDIKALYELRGSLDENANLYVSRLRSGQA